MNAMNAISLVWLIDILVWGELTLKVFSLSRL